MKLPGLPSFIGKRKVHPEVFLSLLLYPDAVEAAIWELGPHGIPTILGAVTQDIVHDSWQERSTAADKCITTLEDIAQTTNIQKVILGLPAPYLTKDGDVVKDIRPAIKKLTHGLGLTPIGFVAIYQSIVHKYKKLEGVPPSLILLGFTAGSITVSLYRVGNFAGQVTIPKEGSIAEHLEDAFAQFPNSTVLPSRILLYGTKPTVLEVAKRELMKHHWTARSNFIHFPKVEIFPGDGAAIAVSYAGAGELTHTIGEDETPSADETLEEVEQTAVVLPSQEDPVDEEDIRSDDAEEAEEELEEELVEEDELDEEISSAEADSLEPDSIEEEVVVGEEASVEESEEEFISEEQSNVIPVDPEALGFKKHGDEIDEETAVDVPHHPRKKKFNASHVFQNIRLKFPTFKKSHVMREDQQDSPAKKNPARLLVLLIPVLVLLVGGYVVIDTFLPKANVTIKTIPKTIEQSATVKIDTDSTSVTGSTIPGKKKEQSVSGDKSVPATGKKTIGDSSHGTLTIINKSTVPKTFRKGTTVSTGGIDFTLDADVSVASASETFQGITYSKENVAASAKQIGTKGNISAGHDFTINGISSSLAGARNDQAFTGGTSKDVTVVARSDQESIVKDLTTELIAKAKDGFEASGQEILIPETIKTTVTERVFSAEIGQQATEVNGKVTVTITGIGYNTSDITSLLRDKVKSQVSQGYVLSSDLPKIETGTPTIAKDGTITLTATISSSSFPDLQLPALSKQIAGKTDQEAKAILTALPGVGDVSFSINSLLHKNRLPKRAQNITLLVSNGT